MTEATGDRVLITGGGTGIGRALAHQLAARGMQVIICGRRADKLAETAAGHPRITAIPCDITNDTDRAALIAAVTADGRPLDLLINNAAVIHHYRLDDHASVDLAQIEHDLATNLLAPIALTNGLLPALLRSPRAAIMNILSPVGIVPLATFPIYSASKAALYSYSRSLRRHCRGTVRVIAVFPPSVDTAMFPGGRTPISPEACATELLRRYAVGSDEIWIGEARYLRLLNRLVPGRVFDIVNNYPGMDG